MIALYSQEICCLRCGKEADGNPFSSGPIVIGAGSVVTSDTGWKLNKVGATYCPECAPTVRFCRGCGCTDEAGCPERCAWVLPDLCSVCASNQMPDSRICICGAILPKAMLHCMLCGHDAAAGSTCPCKGCAAARRVELPVLQGAAA